MKRSKQRSSSSFSRSSDEVSAIFAKPAEKEITYDDCVVGKPDDAFAAYSMKSRYDKGALLAHPKFGKGVVVAVQDSRIIVAFADGPKKLGHGAE